MTTVYEVPAEELIAKAAKKLKSLKECKPPEWARFAKTGVHREFAPQDPDWWYTREAAILRKVYLNGPIGTMHLRAKFSGPLDRGSKPYRTKSGSGSVVRKSLQQLEKAGLIKTTKGKGREMTPKGREMLDNISYDVMQDIIKDDPELGKY
jgi:small subunit ribosomal protein S19e